MRPFNKTTATLVRPHPFSTLCPTPLGNSPVCMLLLKYKHIQRRFQSPFDHLIMSLGFQLQPDGCRRPPRPGPPTAHPLRLSDEILTAN